MFEKEIVVDARGHLLGRLASYVAKELLNGQKIVVVRCEQINKSGSLFRNKIKYHEFLNKSHNANPRRMFSHYRSPARIFWRTVRGMTPHKTARGAAALGRLKTFEGVPFPYDHKSRMVVPDALKIVRLRDNRKFCCLGDLAKMVGWGKKETVERLEARRKQKAEKYYQLKKKKDEARAKAMKHGSLNKMKDELAKYGF